MFILDLVLFFKKLFIIDKLFANHIFNSERDIFIFILFYIYIGTDLVGKLLKMQQLEDDDELAYSAEEGLDQANQQQDDGRPMWMRTLHNSATTWLQLLPTSLQVCFNLHYIMNGLCFSSK